MRDYLEPKGHTFIIGSYPIFVRRKRKCGMKGERAALAQLFKLSDQGLI